MNEKHAILVSLIDRYMSGGLDPLVTGHEVHRLAYFMKGAGDSLCYSFRRTPNGPYGDSLNDDLQIAERDFILRREGDDAIDTRQIFLAPRAVVNAQYSLKSRTMTRKRLDDVSKLIDGFETPSGLKLLSMVHWVAESGSVVHMDEVFWRMESWEEGHAFSPEQIKLAVKVLSEQGWIAPTIVPDEREQLVAASQ